MQHTQASSHNNTVDNTNPRHSLAQMLVIPSMKHIQYPQEKNLCDDWFNNSNV